MGTLALAGLLLGHALIHGGYLSKGPPATAGGPAWPFALGPSRLLDRFGFGHGPSRVLGVALVAVTIAAFALAALATLGVVPVALWGPTVTVGATASLGLLVLFFHPWLILGVAIDLLLLWAVLVARWTPG